MKLFRSSLTLLSFGLLLVAQAPADTPAPKKKPEREAPPGATLRLSTIGYTPKAQKIATIAGESTSTFSVIDLATGKPVYSGELAPPVRTAPTDTNEVVRLADFTTLKQPGRYALEVQGLGRSAPFTVGEEVWSQPFKLVTRAMYLWRCGMEVHAEWNGQRYHQAPCHLEDGYLDAVGGPAGQRRDGRGGWHDAGDYNKYVVNAGVTTGLMFRAWETFRAQIQAIPLELPESGQGLPDLLAELKYEYDWLFCMQLEDGRVYHKLSSRDFRYWGPAEDDKDPRFFTPWSTIATADYTAMMALGARHFREFDPAYADRCLAAAKLGWAALEAHPNQVDPDLTGFHTGGYTAPDWSHRLWAAAELWETTEDVAYLKAFETRATAVEFSRHGPGWGDVRDLALGAYLATRHPKPRNADLVKRITQNLIAVADKIVEEGRSNPHGRPLGSAAGDFFWGCNGMVAAQTYLLQLASQMNPQHAADYRATIELAVVHLFGRNYHGRSYVTGLGANPPEHPHDRRGEPAWPGYLVGGPNPDARYYFDELPEYSRNEIAINWNSALIFALASLLPENTR